LGGYVLGQLQRAPKVGDTVRVPSGRLLRVEELDELRVARVRLLPTGAAPTPAPQMPVAQAASGRNGNRPDESRAGEA
ncbi:MAG: hypothetical protein M3380_14340, partial [Chloroflexota bacterium]|nr:hypothetical protein [Chloroflexota bacterium]